MKQLFTIYLLFFAVLTFGQRSEITSTDYFSSLPGVKLLFGMDTLDIAGRFHNTNGFTGYTIVLDSNKHFEKLGHDCVSRSKWDSGSWTIKNGKTVIISSSKGKDEYEIVTLANYYFLIPIKQRHRFIRDYNTTKVRFKNAKPLTHDNRTYTIDWMIAYSLIEKFYGKELEDLNGT